MMKVDNTTVQDVASTSNACDPAVFVTYHGLIAFPDLTSDQLVDLARVDGASQPELKLWFLEFLRRPRRDKWTLRWYSNYVDYNRMLEEFCDRKGEKQSPSHFVFNASGGLRAKYAPGRIHEDRSGPVLIEDREFASLVLETFGKRFEEISGTPSPRPSWKEVVLPEYVSFLEYRLTRHQYLYDVEDEEKRLEKLARVNRKAVEKFSDKNTFEGSEVKIDRLFKQLKTKR